MRAARSIRALLEGMQHLLGWEPIMEGDNIIGMFDVTGGGAISLEPGGQFELSGAPVETVHQTASELMAHLAQVREVAKPFGIGFLGLGMTPNWTRADMPMMPKGRYKIMTNYMPKVGTLGLDMMYRTCTVQANLDFSSEADMVKKLRVSLALQPVATALFANSPFTEGKPNGFLSFRSRDLARHRQRPRRHAAVGVRGRHGLRALGRLRARRADVFRQARRQIYRRRRQVVPRFLRRQARRTAGRAADHLRLGQSPVARSFPRCGSSVIWKCAAPTAGRGGGCRRSPPSGSGCSTTTTRSTPAGTWSRTGARPSGRSCATTCRSSALRAEIRGRNVLTLAQETLRFAARGLARRKYLDRNGRDETRYLRPLEEIVARGITPAEELLEKFHGRWNGSVEPMFEEYAY